MNLAWYWTALIAFAIVNFLLVSASVLVYAERKVSGYMQNRPGTQPCGPVRIPTTLRRRGEAGVQGEHRAGTGQPVRALDGAHADGGYRHDGGSADPICPQRGYRRHGRECPGPVGPDLHFRIRSHAGWMELQQQVLPPRGTSFERPDDLL